VVEMTKRAYGLTDSQWNDLTAHERAVKIAVTEVCLEHPELR
jgi:hypothetical protein